ncbi:unnamed protein product, partial [Ixodes pacificus]
RISRVPVSAHKSFQVLPKAQKSSQLLHKGFQVLRKARKSSQLLTHKRPQRVHNVHNCSQNLSPYPEGLTLAHKCSQELIIVHTRPQEL